MKEGITGRPVPCSVVFDHKWKDGILAKLKTRICIAGHPGNVQKDIHYDQVFSASPNQHTERMLQALRVNLRLENLAWDVSQAYTWAPLPSGERIAVVYPDGFKRYDEFGNELGNRFYPSRIQEFITMNRGRKIWFLKDSPTTVRSEVILS